METAKKVSMSIYHERPVSFSGKRGILAFSCKTRLFRRAGILSVKDMRKVEEAVKVQLDIP